MKSVTPPSWVPQLDGRPGPIYQAIVGAMEEDILAGRLIEGSALPAQRELAALLGVNFTTVTRAYAEARRRGLITAHVGRGTFVGGGPGGGPDDDLRGPREYDLSVNSPPLPDWMIDAFQSTLARLSAEPRTAHALLGYRTRLGSSPATGMRWLEARGLQPARDRVTLVAGAQHALSLLLATMTRPGDTILVEELCYPGVRSAASQAGVRPIGVAMDEQGLLPEALERACRATSAKLLVCVPTLQNPTTAVMSPERRHAIIEVARRFALRIVEDDICGPLLTGGATPLAAMAPELVSYIGSLSKCVAPALRVAFVLTPTAGEASQLQGAVRSSVLMLSPLPVAIAAAWVADGTAERAVREINQEAAARGQIARRILGDAHLSVPPGSLHAWLRLPTPWTLAAFVAQAQQQGIRVAPADWYAMPKGDTPAPAPDAVRLSLGTEPERTSFERAFLAVAEVLRQPAGLREASM